MSVPIQSVTFWLNAFLPWSIPGATTNLRQGPYAGYTAIAGPRYCLTDQRGFSSNIGAESRMQSAVIIDFSGSTPAMIQQHRCNYTTECDRKSGRVLRREKSNTSRMKFTLASAEPTVVIHMDCVASNPCTSAAWAFGDIEYKGAIAINQEKRSIAINLMIGVFPAYEGYAAINNGIGAILFRQMPPAGIKTMYVPPRTNRPIRSQLEDRDGDGVFELPAIETAEH